MASQLSYTKFDVAAHQLERALTLYLQDKDFLSAITLAGASDEILGDLLSKQGRVSSYSGLKVGFERVYRLLFGADPDTKAFNELANGVRNGLKHLRDGVAMHFDAESNASDILDRACSNYWKLTSNQTPAMAQFFEARRNNGNDEA